MLFFPSRAHIRICVMKIITRVYTRIRRSLGFDRTNASCETPHLTPKRSLGNKGEDHAWLLLRQRGHKLVERNWSCRNGELDLVTWHANTLVFTEVRTRSSTAFGTPAESVNSKKQERMRRAAHGYLAKHYADGR